MMVGNGKPVLYQTDIKVESGNGSEEGHMNQLGTLNGCYVPCLLNIMGIVLFMRLPWATGQVGALTSCVGLAGQAHMRWRSQNCPRRVPPRYSAPAWRCYQPFARSCL
jgi:hypothetical protein